MNSHQQIRQPSDQHGRQHSPVMLDAAVAALVVNQDGAYVDCTYGRGGHSQLIADRLSPTGRLLAIDKDQSAIANAQQRFANDSRVAIQQGSFAQVASFVKQQRLAPLDGVLMDLGVSSPQLEDAQRGFSFNLSGPLDMRMDQSSGQTAAEWLAQASEREIAQTLATYGEERYARRIAKRIVAERGRAPITTTDKLVEIVAAAMPRKEEHKHPATRTFQAIRIQVNDELNALETCLADLLDLLRAGGRIVVISFHSLEDRIVKRFFRQMHKGDPLPDKLPVTDDQINRRLKLVGKAIRPSQEEVDANIRARSSIMRVAEKLP
ncbi:MAG: 16S rRNA (cytosine(1402)-N(4))-methyltransferase RsmH [Pseudomonadales bacterium]